MASAALACGPFFPSSILSDRTVSLKAVPRNSFAFEAAHLAARAPGQAADKYWDEEERRAAQDKVEKANLSPAQALAIAAMRGSSSGDAALLKAAELPRAIALYTAGAADFHAGNYAAARERFAAVLAMPAGDAAPRLLWAAYSLARTDLALGDLQKAEKEFADVRHLAETGAPDELGLVPASLGEEARLHLRAANAILGAAPIPLTPRPMSAEPAPDPDMVLAKARLSRADASAYGREMHAAAALYARQAAYDSDVGIQSLRTVAANITADPVRLDATIADPLLQKLVVSYALTREAFEAFDMDYSGAASKLKPVATGDGKWMEPETASLLTGVIDALDRAHVAAPAAADRLAALAYRTGRFDLARTMADKSHTPMAEWVKAKLSLQAGDLAGAAAHYAAAARGLPSADMEPDNAPLLVGEQGAVALARDQYVDALRFLYSTKTYWSDSAYIAERVLTADELKTFVDAEVPASRKPDCQQNVWEETPDRTGALRDLLARRLMREKRYDEALPYFCSTQTRNLAQSYARDVRAGASGWDKVGRARHLFQAAQIVRKNGMEIMGTEVHPDYAVYEGSYSTNDHVDELNPADRKLITAAERSRVRTSTPSPDLRFHYRYVAAQEAQDAAGLLPPKTQAFAAVLCAATGWMLDAPDGGKRGWSIYQRYVKEGAHMPWAAHFGRGCPDPDFDSATFLSRNVRALERSLARHAIFGRRSH